MRISIQSVIVVGVRMQRSVLDGRCYVSNAARLKRVKTMTTDTTDESVDPRLEAISAALQEHQSAWVDTHDGEVVFDTLLAAAIAAAAMDQLLGDNVAYCNPQCHEDEYNYFIEFIRAFSEDCPDDNYPCSDKILEGIRAEEEMEPDERPSRFTADIRSTPRNDTDA